jgi:small-conductance mechanosensitive channel
MLGAYSTMWRFLCRKIARILINTILGLIYVILGLLPNILVDAASQGGLFSFKALLCSPLLIGYVLIAIIYNFLAAYLNGYYTNKDKDEAIGYLKPQVLAYFEQGMASSIERLRSGDYAGAKETNRVIADLVKRSRRW